MAETKYTLTVAGEPLLRPGITLAIETNETDFDKVLDDLMERAYSVDSLLEVWEKFSKATNDLGETIKKSREELSAENKRTLLNKNDSAED